MPLARRGRSGGYRFRAGCESCDLGIGGVGKRQAATGKEVMTHDLEQLGLSRAESVLYAALLKSGTGGVSALVKKTKLGRKVAEQALESLTAKGLVASFRNKTGMLFTALDTKELLSHLDAQVQSAQSQREKAAKVLEQLKSQILPGAVRPKLQFFTGIDGVRSALEETLSSKERTLRAFLAVSDLTDFVGPDFLERYTSRRIASGLTLHAMRTFERDKRSARMPKHAKYYLTNREERREVRYINEDLAFPVTTYLFDQKILTISSKSENFAVLVESRELCEMQKRLFQLLWRSLSIREIASGRRPERRPAEQ